MNKIQAIFYEGIWIENQAAINKYFLGKFEDVFSTEIPSLPQTLGDLGFQSISTEENDFLMSIPAEVEIKVCIDALHPLKALGPDGFSGIFFRHYWETIRHQVIGFVQESFIAGELVEGLNKTFIILVPKSENATDFNHFRPISLCNFTYKIISKIIAERPKNLLPQLISPNQGAFVSGRWIADNTVLAQELVHKIRKFKGKCGLMMAKIDLARPMTGWSGRLLRKFCNSGGFLTSFRK